MLKSLPQFGHKLIIELQVLRQPNVNEAVVCFSGNRATPRKHNWTIRRSRLVRTFLELSSNKTVVFRVKQMQLIIGD